MFFFICIFFVLTDYLRKKKFNFVIDEVVRKDVINYRLFHVIVFFKENLTKGRILLRSFDEMFYNAYFISKGVFINNIKVTSVSTRDFFFFLYNEIMHPLVLNSTRTSKKGVYFLTTFRFNVKNRLFF